MNTANSIPLLAVDIGNTQMKLGLIHQTATDGLPEPSAVLRLPTRDEARTGLTEWLPSQTLAWAVATVHREAERRLAGWVAAHRPADRYQLLQNHDLPVAIRVEQPERVGTDRLLAAIAANTLRQSGQAAIIVGAGTAITVDLLSEDGAFEGGVILPGFGIMARALARDTDQLPFVEGSLNDLPPAVIGKSTVAAIRSGLYWGSVGGVCEVVRRISAALAHPPQIFIAGGDAAKLGPFLPASAQIVSELVLSGIAVVQQARMPAHRG